MLQKIQLIIICINFRYLLVSKYKTSISSLKTNYMKSLFTFILIGLLYSSFSYAQNIGINSTGATPDISAILDIDDANKGLLIPRVALLSNIDDATILLPANSLLVYNTNAGITGGAGEGYYYNSGTTLAPLWVRIADATSAVDTLNNWRLIGNAGTDISTNFIGTTDDQPLLFRVNNQKSGLIDHINSKTLLGYKAGDNFTTSSSIIGIGSHALENSTTASNLIAIGDSALFESNIFGYNTAVGHQALRSNINGTANVAVGLGALYANVSGRSNIALGSYVLEANQDGDYNVGLGHYVLGANVSGTQNIGIGMQALFLNTASDNIGIGAFSLFANTSGYSNLGIGTNSLYSNTIGYSNVAIGLEALRTNGIGNNNIGIGNNVLFSNTDGSNNIAIGNSSMQANTLGENNIAIGSLAAENNSYASNNVAIGVNALRLQDFTNGFVPYPTFNVAVGHNALFKNNPIDLSTGIYNTAVGDGALLENTIGLRNTAIGARSLEYNTEGNWNTAIGVDALRGTFPNTIGDNNIAVGFEAMFRNASANDNIAIGNHTLFNQSYDNGGVKYSSRNIAIGYEAMYANQPTSTTNGYSNTAIGYQSLKTNTIGTDNLAFGHQTLFSNTTSSENVAIGKNALYTQSFDNGGSTYSLGNTALGFEALYTNNPTFLGNGGKNTAIGYMAARNATTGFHNVAIGDSSASTLETGFDNTLLGSKADVGFEDLTNAVAIGANARVNCSNCLALGGDEADGFAYTRVGINNNNPFYTLDINQIGVYGIGLTNVNTWEIYNTANSMDLYYNGVRMGIFSEITGAYTPMSDVRLKKNIVPAYSVLNKVMHLQPKTYQYKSDKTNRSVFGLIAQEVEKDFPEFVYTSNTKGKDDIKDIHTIDYAGISVVAIKAIQEQQIIIQSQEDRINTLQQEVLEMKVLMQQILNK
jgi:hypothetical protein